MSIYKEAGIKRVVGYHDLFKERMMPNIGKCILGFDKKLAVPNLVGNMSKKLCDRPFYNPYYYGNEEEIDCLRFFFSDINQRYLLEILDRYSKLKKREPIVGGDKFFVGATEASVLYIMRSLMASTRTCDLSRKDAEKNFFKALMAANQLTSNPGRGRNPYDENTDKEMHYAAEFIRQLGISDIVYSDTDLLIVTQTIACISFFEFAQQHPRLSLMIADYCAIHGADNWWMVPKMIWSLFAITGKSIGHVNFENLKTKDQKLLRYIAFKSSRQYDEIIPIKDNRDYKAFRAKPLIAINDEELFVFNVQFLVEHIYNSLYFEFRNIAVRKFGMTPQEFNSLYTTEFSEDYLFARNMKEASEFGYDIALTDPECIARDGSKDRCNASPPDFYIRKGNVVFLFENKDVKIKDSIRENGTLDDYLTILRRNLIRDTKPKGVGQLVRTIGKIRSGEFQRRWDPDCPRDAIIYPVLVVADVKHTGLGVKNYLQHAVYDECSFQRVDSTNIKPLIYTDVSTLVLFKGNFKEKGFQFYFDEYLSDSDIAPFLKSNHINDLFNGLAAFPEYMKTKQRKNVEEFSKRWEEYLRK